jgi:hypothetical protein
MGNTTQHEQIQRMWYLLAVGLALFVVVVETWYQVNALVQEYQFNIDRWGDDFGNSLIIGNFVGYTNVFIVGWMLALGLLFWNMRISRRAWWVFVGVFGVRLIVVFVMLSAMEFYRNGNFYDSEMLQNSLSYGTSFIHVGWIIPPMILRYEFDLSDNQLVIYNMIVNLMIYVLCVSIGISALRHKTEDVEPLYLRRFRYPHMLVLSAVIIEGIGFVSHRFFLARYSDEYGDYIAPILYQQWLALTNNRIVLMSVILIAFFVMRTPHQRRVAWVVYAGAMVIGLLMTTSHAAMWDFLYQNCDEDSSYWVSCEPPPFELYTMSYAIGAVMSGAIVSWPYLRSFLETPRVAIPPTLPPSLSTDMSIADLERLEGLLQRGLIDQTEFQQLKSKILRRGE